MSDEGNLPDWLKQLRPQELGGPLGPAAEPTQPAAWQAEPAPQPAPEPMPAAAPTPTSADSLDALREIASVELPPVEEPRRLNLPIIGQLTPFQRFVLALMLFLNVSVLGCLFLMVMEKISLVR